MQKEMKKIIKGTEEQEKENVFLGTFDKTCLDRGEFGGTMTVKSSRPITTTMALFFCFFINKILCWMKQNL